MPIIPKVGRHSPRGRLIITCIYIVLCLGSVTTVYPFWLMISGSIGMGGYGEFPLVPRYLYSHRGLFEAYLASRYLSPEVLERQWKVSIPFMWGRDSIWRQVPGQRPASHMSLVRNLQVHFCVRPYEDFHLAFEAIGSPRKFDEAFSELVERTYPFAVDAIRRHVEAHSPFELDRHSFVRFVELAFSTYFARFVLDYDARDRPDPASAAYQEIVQRYPPLRDSDLFRATMRNYILCREPGQWTDTLQQRAEDFLQFITDLPLALRDINHSDRSMMEADQRFEAWLQRRYGSLDALNDAYRTEYDHWIQPRGPWERLYQRNRYTVDTLRNRDWYEFKRELPADLIRPAVIEHDWCTFLETRYEGGLVTLNQAWGTQHIRFMDMGLPESRPQHPAKRADWDAFVRDKIALRYLQFDGGHDRWRDFLLKRFGSLEAINGKLTRDWISLDDIHLPNPQRKAVGHPRTKLEFDLLLRFLSTKMLLDDVRILSPSNHYRRFLMSKYGSLEAINTAHGLAAISLWDVYFPMQTVDWRLFDDTRGRVRWTMLTRGYQWAINQLFRYKRSMWNTFVYCTAVVATALLINPMCAYALSRFNLPGAYHILLFLLATMAFPAEVTMIPNFLLLKNFPLLRIVCCLAGVFVGGGLILMYAPSKRALYPFVGAIVGGLIGVTVVSSAIEGLFDVEPKVSLLNTYWALILPGVASGYSIFILKGFFDSLPQELYESAVIDGAKEMRIFTTITLPLSTPVLAVIALWSFTSAYGAFTWALIICQDPKMWTIMVHLYQLQFHGTSGGMLAALVLTSIPTLFVFLVVQKIILRGIILPTFK